MIDMKEQYEKAKKKAKELMAMGRVNEYIWQLAEVRRLQVQLKRVSR